MVTICANNMAKGCCKFENNSVLKSSQWPFPELTSKKCFPNSNALPLEIIQYIKAVNPPVTVI